MKLETLLKGAGRYLYKTAPGKPWKARKDDQLRFLMPILTPQGPLDIVVPNLRERKLLHQYDLAIRMCRAGADGAEAALKAFEGKTVGGHTLITDVNLLIELEEAGVALHSASKFVRLDRRRMTWCRVFRHFPISRIFRRRVRANGSRSGNHPLLDSKTK